MRTICVLAIALLSLASSVRADDFAQQVDLSPLAMAAVQDNQTMKTLDTFARQAIWQITGHEKLDGHDSVYTLLDMSFHPDEYVTRNIVKIVNVPLREEFENLQSIDGTEKKRIVKEGTVSLAFLERPEVQGLLQQVQASSVNKSKAISQVMLAVNSMGQICQVEHDFIPAGIIAPAQSGGDGLWHRPTEVIGDVPELVDVLKQHGTTPPPGVGGYDDKAAVLGNIFAATGAMLRGWDAHDAQTVSQSAKDLGDLLVQVNPAAYPSHAKRATEVLYNRLTKLTIPGAMFYFVAFVLFLMTAQADVPKLRPWAIAFMITGLAIHSTGIGIRWWLVGGLFPPIKNEFESVMCSAWFGAVVGLTLELKKSRRVFRRGGEFCGDAVARRDLCRPVCHGSPDRRRDRTGAGHSDELLALHSRDDGDRELFAHRHGLPAQYLVARAIFLHEPSPRSNRTRIIPGDARHVQPRRAAAGVLDARSGDYFRRDLGGSELGQAVGLGSEGNVRAGDVDGLSRRGPRPRGDGG